MIFSFGFYETYNFIWLAVASPPKKKEKKKKEGWTDIYKLYDNG